MPYAPTGFARAATRFGFAVLSLVLSCSSSSAQPFLYAASGPGYPNPQIVFALDLSSAAMNPISVGMQSSWDAAVSRNGRLYLLRFVGRYEDFRVSIVDTASQQVTSDFGLIAPAGGVAVSPQQRLAYATDCTTLAADATGVLDVVDLPTRSRIASIPLDVDPKEVRLDAEGTLAYVSGGGYCQGQDDARLAVVDTNLRQQVGGVPLPGRAELLTSAPAAQRLFATSFRDPEDPYLTVVDMRSATVVAEHHLAARAGDIVASPDGAIVYASFGSPAIRVAAIDTASGAELGSLSLPADGYPGPLEIHPLGHTLYAAYTTGQYKGRIAEIETASMTAQRDFPLPGAADQLHFVNQCTGDCDASGAVEARDLTVAVEAALDPAAPLDCPSADIGGDGRLTVDELIAAVHAARGGCAEPPPTRTPTCTPTPTTTPLEPGGCGLVCDGRGCADGPCQYGELTVYQGGYCTGERVDGCACEAFECFGTCRLEVDPVISPLVGDLGIVTGVATYTSPFGREMVHVNVTGGAEPVFGGMTGDDGRFAVVVPLADGLNALTLEASAQGRQGPPASCRNVTRHDHNGGLLDVCSCASAPCSCAATSTPTATPSRAPISAATPCNGACPTATPTPTAAPTCRVDMSGRSPTPTA